MKGCFRRIQRERENQIIGAWWTHNFSRTGKHFRELKYYLDKMKVKEPQSADDVAAIFQTFVNRGLAKIRQVEKK